MKFILPFALFAATLVTAQDPDCEANYIVETCLTSENKKLEDCATSDYECLCRAAEAVSTCFNNCPKDPRKSTFQSQVIIHCANASIYATTKPTPATTGSSSSNTEAAEAETTTESDATNTAAEGETASSTESSTGSTASPESGVGQLARNTAGVLLVVAGAVAAML